MHQGVAADTPRLPPLHSIRLQRAERIAHAITFEALRVEALARVAAAVGDTDQGLAERLAD